MWNWIQDAFKTGKLPYNERILRVMAMTLAVNTITLAVLFILSIKISLEI